MKLSEIFDNIDKSSGNESWVDLSELLSVFDINGYIDSEGERLKCYFFLKWHCTDSHVGGRVYFLDDKPVAISWQYGRKSSENYEWVSKETYLKVREYLMSLCGKHDVDIEPLDLDVDLGEGHKIDYSSQLLTDTVIYKPTGEMVTVIKRYDGMKEISNWGKVDIQFKDGTKKTSEMKDILVPYSIIKTA